MNELDGEKTTNQKSIFDSWRVKEIDRDRKKEGEQEPDGFARLLACLHACIRFPIQPFRTFTVLLRLLSMCLEPVAIHVLHYSLPRRIHSNTNARGSCSLSLTLHIPRSWYPCDSFGKVGISFADMTWRFVSSLK